MAIAQAALLLLNGGPPILVSPMETDCCHALSSGQTLMMSTALALYTPDLNIFYLQLKLVLFCFYVFSPTISITADLSFCQVSGFRRLVSFLSFLETFTWAEALDVPWPSTFHHCSIF